MYKNISWCVGCKLYFILQKQNKMEIFFIIEEEPRDTTVLQLPMVYLHESLEIYEQVAYYSTYNAWKHFTPEVILHSVVKYTNEEAYGEGGNDLSMCELESFIALQYVRELYGKNHLLYFLYNKAYGIPIFSEYMSHVRFTAILKYLSFDDNPNRRCTGPGADRFTAIRVVFQILTSICQ